MLNREHFISLVGLGAAGVATTGATAPDSAKAWRILFEGLRSPDSVTQAESARLLGELGSSKAVPELLNYSLTSGWHSKTAGLYALQRLGQPDATKTLAPLVEIPGVYDDFYWHYAFVVRASAALAVQVLDPSTALPFFNRELAKEGHWRLELFCIYYSSVLIDLPTGDPILDPLKAKSFDLLFCRRFSRPAQLTLLADALGKVGTKAAAQELQWMLTLPSRYIRGAAAANLANCLPSAEAQAQLIHFFEHEPTDFAKIKTAGALARLGDEKSDRYLQKKMGETSDPFIKTTALAETAPRQNIDTLSPYFTDPSEWVRAAALETLEPINSPEAQAIATRHLDDSATSVRMQAAKTVLACSERSAS